MNDLISVIVPVYNVEKYLSECIESILAQTYTNFELILVDDGSKDKSGKICDDYATKDKRVRVFHKQNGGVSSARNYGLECMSGNYYMFIDSDDVIVPIYIEVLSAAIGDADEAVCRLFSYTNANHFQSSIDNLEIISFTGHDKVLLAYQNAELFNMKSPCCKLYNSKCGEKIRFDVNFSLGEDWMYNLSYLKYVRKIVRVNFAGYGYRPNAASLAHTSQSKYTTIFEHGSNALSINVHKLEADIGLDASFIQKEKNRECTYRYFHEIMNLVAENTPYTRKKGIERIVEIHRDEPFIETIRHEKFFNLSGTGKISWVCAWLKNARISYSVALLVKKLFG